MTTYPPPTGHIDDAPVIQVLSRSARHILYIASYFIASPAYGGVLKRNNITHGSESCISSCIALDI
jgi:hypothetical protein